MLRAQLRGPCRRAARGVACPAGASAPATCAQRWGLGHALALTRTRRSAVLHARAHLPGTSSFQCDDAPTPLAVPSTSHSALKRGRAILRRVRHVQPDDAPLPLAGAQHQPLRPEEGQGHECPTACCRGNAPTSNIPVGRYTRVSRCLSSMHEWAFAPLATAGPHGSGDGVPLLVSTRSIFACRFGRACLNRRASPGLVLLQELCSPQGFCS